MTAHRATAAILSAAMLSAAALAIPAAPAQAQVADDVVLNIMRECARIDDPSARLACYDNNIRSAGGTPRNTVPGEVRVQGGGAPVAGVPGVSGPTGFGREDVRTPDRFATPAGQLDEITGVIASIRQREPGIYVFTLEDGAEWVFNDTVDMSYNPPRRGSRVEIRRGDVGGYLMRFNNQVSVRVRRIS